MRGPSGDVDERRLEPTGGFTHVASGTRSAALPVRTPLIGPQ